MASSRSLEGKVAIVTGGASGIGRMTALTLGSEGTHVTIADVNGDGAKAVAQEIQSQGGRAVAVKTDVSKRGDVADMVEATVKAFGGVDIAVNDAAVTERGSSVLNVTEEAWDRILAVNLKGPMFVCQAVIPHMMERKGGVIVNVSSGSGFRPSGANLPYGCSKAAVAHLSRSLAHDLAPHNIRVNTVAPGLTDTPMTRKNWPTDEAILARAKDSNIANPMGVLLEPKDLANAIVFLASDQARYITGQTLHVNAGSWLS